jgi:hypothetical protein
MQMDLPKTRRLTSKGKAPSTGAAGPTFAPQRGNMIRSARRPAKTSSSTQTKAHPRSLFLASKAFGELRILMRLANSERNGQKLPARRPDV